MFTIEKTKEEITRTTEHEQSIAWEKWPWMSQALNWMNTKIAILTPKNKKNLTEIQSNIYMYIYVAIRYLAKINTWNLVKKKLVKKETHRFNFKFVNHWIIILLFHLLEKRGVLAVMLLKKMFSTIYLYLLLSSNNCVKVSFSSSPSSLIHHKAFPSKPENWKKRSINSVIQLSCE